MCRWLWIVLIGLVGLASGCGSKNPNLALTLEPVETLTADHESEAHSLIEYYWIAAGSLEAQKNPAEFTDFVASPLLEMLTSFGIPAPGASFNVTTSVSLDKVIVLEYTSARIRAIACGHLYQQQVSYDGNFIKADNPLPIMQAFAFVPVNDVWKLSASYDFGDTKGALRDWDYVSDAEKAALGDLPSYTNLYFDCRIN